MGQASNLWSGLQAEEGLSGFAGERLCEQAVKNIANSRP